MASLLVASPFSGAAVRVQSKSRCSRRGTPLSVFAATKKTPAPPPSRFAKAEPKAAAVALVCGECGAPIALEAPRSHAVFATEELAALLVPSCGCRCGAASGSV